MYFNRLKYLLSYDLVVRRKTIYEYHRLQFTKEDIKNWTVIYLYALPTCVELKDCKSCLAQSIGFEVGSSDFNYILKI